MSAIDRKKLVEDLGQLSDECTDENFHVEARMFSGFAKVIQKNADDDEKLLEELLKHIAGLNMYSFS